MSAEASSRPEDRRRVEIVHESLLKNWPRLVRWQTQDQEGAQLRDELRQAAQLWEEHNRAEDLLWTGTTFREFQLWRERYPGGLTEIEEAFAAAMTAFALRRRHRRQWLTVAVIALLTIGLGSFAALWRASEAAKLAAEASKLLALGRNHLEDDPTAALALARASLELADTAEARRFAVEVLWRGPVARILPVKRMAREAGLPDDPSPLAANSFALSPDGRWLATRAASNRQILLFSRQGGPPRPLPRQPDGEVRLLAFGPRSDLLITGGSGSSMRFWSVPELEELRTVELGGLVSHGFVLAGKLWTTTAMDAERREVLARVWSLPDGKLARQGGSWGARGSAIDPSGTVVAQGRGRQVVVRPLEASDGSRERIVGEAGDVVAHLAFAPRGDRIASLDRSGEIRIWSASGASTAPLYAFQGPRYDGFMPPRFDSTGRFVNQIGPNGACLVWDLESPPGAEPRLLQRSVPDALASCSFDPAGRWVVTDIEDGIIEFWPLDSPWPRTLPAPLATASVVFTEDGRSLAICPLMNPAILWPLDAASGEPRKLAGAEECVSLAVHADREEILVGNDDGGVLLSPIGGGIPRRLPGGFGPMVGPGAVAFDRDGRRAVAGPYGGGRSIADPAQRVLKVWDLDSGREQVYSVARFTDADWGGGNVGFAYDGSLFANLGKGGRVMRLKLPREPDGEIAAETVVDAASAGLNLSRDGRFLIVLASATPGTHNFCFEQLLLFDLVAGTSRPITSHGDRLFSVVLDATDRTLVSADVDGVVRAGPATGGEPHLLISRPGGIGSVAISPDGRWIASTGDTPVRLWPMPDLSKPPLRTLPHDELLAKLDAFTNLRAVRDLSASTGWSFEVAPLSGWEMVPEW